jgi:hypothetical protein
LICFFKIFKLWCGQPPLEAGASQSPREGREAMAYIGLAGLAVCVVWNYLT